MPCFVGQNKKLSNNVVLVGKFNLILFNNELKIMDKGASSEIRKSGFERNEKGINEWLILKNIIDDRCSF